MTEPCPFDCRRWVPVFPLPNSVLLPRAIQPLHVFEQRYRALTRDALAGSRLIALVMLRPGNENRYHRLDAPIHSHVCVGRILREERLPDGRYNFLLQGLCRAEIRRENHDRPYRRAMLAHRPIQDTDPQGTCAIRARIKTLLNTPPLADIARRANWPELLACPELTLSDVIDVLAGVVMKDPEEKQRILAEPCVCRRAQLVFDALDALSALVTTHHAARAHMRAWPRSACQN